MKWMRILGIFVIAILAVPKEASAQMRTACLPYETAVGVLTHSHGKQKIGFGIGFNGGAVYELYVSNTGAWTILITKTNGISCPAASGDSWIDDPWSKGVKVYRGHRGLVYE